MESQEAGAASGILNATQQVGGSLGLSVLVTVFGTASRNEATDQVARFMAEATPAQRLEFRRSGQLPAPWSDQVLASGISSSFVVAAIFAVVAALIALIVIQVRPDDLKRLQGGAGLPLAQSEDAPANVADADARDGRPPQA